jgi:MerR family transcriptional regulator, copper efflux regulator
MKVYPAGMGTGLKIKDVAAASGFTAATLRYYEQIGLLPESSRTPAGYRTYDQRTVERLAFIARAKQLGCTLEEIAGLTTAWEGGQCGPIQDRLRQLVAAKIAAAQSQIGDLMTFASELRTAARALERHRPDGACDGDCGCVSDSADGGTIAATIHAVSLSAKPAAGGEAPIACTLAAGSMKGRIAEWQALLTHVERREPVDGGVRCAFASTVPTSQLIDLVAAEQDCCKFFEFAITVDTRGVALEVRAPVDALPIVTSMFGTPS